jgi:hypothetical protein
MHIEINELAQIFDKFGRDLTGLSRAAIVPRAKAAERLSGQRHRS